MSKKERDAEMTIKKLVEEERRKVNLRRGALCQSHWIDRVNQNATTRLRSIRLHSRVRDMTGIEPLVSQRATGNNYITVNM